MKIVAIDPGVSTGVAIKLDSLYTSITLTQDEIKSGKLLEIIKGSDYVIMERFDIHYAKSQGRVSGHGLATIETVGRIMAYCETLEIPIRRQSPQNRKAFQKQAKSMMQKYDTIHQQDATAHLLSFEYMLGLRP